MPPIIKAERDVDKVEVKGRDGFLTNDLGTYKGVLKSVECSITDLENIDFICAWLTGSGDIIFSNEPSKTYKAIIINKIEFSKVVKDMHSFIIQFDCQPHKYSLTNDLITLTNSPAIVANGATAISKPIIKVYGTGDIDITINSKVIHLEDVVDYMTIDSYIEDAYKDIDPKNNCMTGEFPELIVGINNIAWLGTVSKIEITPNWRYN